jgi:hypothetical protein
MIVFNEHSGDFDPFGIEGAIDYTVHGVAIDAIYDVFRSESRRFVHVVVYLFGELELAHTPRTDESPQNRM